MSGNPSGSETRPGLSSIALLLIAIVGIGSFLAFPLAMARSSHAWSASVSFFCWSVALFVPGMLVAPFWRLRPSEIVAEITLVALLWNVAVWPALPAYRIVVLLVGPTTMLLAASMMRRFNQRRERLLGRGSFWAKLLGASACHSLASFALFLALAYALNIYGYVRTR